MRRFTPGQEEATMLEMINQAPSADLAPYIRQHFLIRTQAEDGIVVSDRLYAHTAFVRAVVGEIPRGDGRVAKPYQHEDPMVMGCSVRGFPIRYAGSFLTVGFAIRPGAWRVFFAAPACDLIDTAQPLSDHWGEIAVVMKARLAQATSDEEIVAAMEDAIRARLAGCDLGLVDTKIDQFEHIMRTHGTARVDDVAARLGLSSRQFERRCLATFGLSPKIILRRSRFLDMAAAMKGYSQPGEEQLARLRYFDMSHRNREFRKFIGVTPGQFLKEEAPMMNIGLEMREKGKQVI
jgi:AraC-like DNA-binding protein